MKYDDFAKLPIFKKGWICLHGINGIMWFKNKPKYNKRWGWWYDGYNVCLDGIFDVDLKGVKPEESLRKVGGKSKISHFMSTDLSIGDEVYIICYDTCYYVHDRAFPITDIYFHYYPRNKTESIGLFLSNDKTDGERSLVYDRKNVYKTKKEAQKECDRRNAELKRKEQKND